MVMQLKYRVCTKFKNKICSRKNYSDNWVSGANSVRTTDIIDHAKSDQHWHAMNFQRKEQVQAQGASVICYSPIARSLNTLPDEDRGKLRRKFEIDYFVAAEQLVFRKYLRICALEAKHGVDLGSSYLHENSGKQFVRYNYC